MPQWLLLALCAAHAQSDEQEVDPYRWVAAPLVEQMDEATQVELRAGKGAVYVPTVSNPADEPAVLIVDERKVRTHGTGEVVPLRAGSYVVIISSGTPSQGVSVPVEVFKGEITEVPVTWGGLRVEVVDERLIPHRGSYDLIRMDDRQAYGTGFGVDTLQGEALQTWLVPPGLYKLVQPGGNYRSRTDFATVHVPEAGFVRYRLVVDPDTGEFRGAGVVLPGEFGDIQAKRGSRWANSLVLGADGALTQSRNVIGLVNQMVVTGDVFLDGQMVYTGTKHFFSVLGQLEEGWSQVRPQEAEPLPLLQTRDSARLDGLYTYFMTPRVGPYIRGASETRLFPSHVLLTEDTTIVAIDPQGNEVREDFAANETWRVSDAFTPTILREGAGLNTRLSNSKLLTLNVRVGFGLRQNYYGGALVLDDDDATPQAVEYVEIETFGQQGMESTVTASARLGFAVYATDLEAFGDFRDFTRPSMEWNNALTMRLTDNVSLRYQLSADYLPQVQSEVQFEQSALLRASWALL